ncbi:B12-binding domain-containing radical SAM protein, partial [Candidatus Woesearchaeota archaeon]|nr:B12-binding domain-containing radical SAM protein [Candidatus Woesearchaeota archaeon]
MKNYGKNVTFVEPRGAPSNVFAKFMTIPLQGPVVLATTAKQAGYSASVLNENILGRDVNDSELANSDVLCVTCLTATANRGKEIAHQYTKVRKERNLESRAIVGGIHASMMPQDFVNDFDQVFVGEAETKIIDLLDGNIEDKIVYGERLEDLDKVPIPDYTLVKGLDRMRIRPVVTSRGCPYGCNFCSVTEMFGRDYRFQSPERIMAELVSYRKSHIFFADDHFAANPRRTEQLLDYIINSKINISWSAQVRAGIAKKPELVRKMRQAGCTTVYIGFESVNPDTLRELNKGQTVEDLETAIRVFHKYGINIHG